MMRSLTLLIAFTCVSWSTFGLSEAQDPVENPPGESLAQDALPEDALPTKTSDLSPLSVLFIGNSYTHGNKLPDMIVALAESTGGRAVRIASHTVGGCTLKRHVEETGAIERIRERKWDVVVLQEQSLAPIVLRTPMFESARRLHAEINKQGARTVFYLTWARQHIPEMQEGLILPSTFNITEVPGPEVRAALEYARRMYGQVKTDADFKVWASFNRLGLEEGLNGAYFGVAEELGAEVAPVGVAWRIALNGTNPPALHAQDKSHASPVGTYLAACVFYMTLLDESPVGTPSVLEREGRVLISLPQEQADRLQRIAEETVLAESLVEGW